VAEATSAVKSLKVRKEAKKMVKRVRGKKVVDSKKIWVSGINGYDVRVKTEDGKIYSKMDGENTWSEVSKF
jgi:hypothetical protein